MPSDEVPSGSNSVTRLTLAQRLRRVRRYLPFFLAILSGISVAGQPTATGSIARQALEVLRAGLGGAVFVLTLLPAYLWASRTRRTQAAPLPRWQYLLFAVPLLAVAGQLIVLSLLISRSHDGPGWLARAYLAYGAWFAATGLGMLGRAAFRGRLRDLFWWERPRWRDEPGTERVRPG